MQNGMYACPVYSCNTPVYSFAKLASSTFDWFEEPLSEIVPILINDACYCK